MTEIHHLKDDIFILKTTESEIISEIKNTEKNENDLLYAEEEAGTLSAVFDLSEEEQILSYIH